MWYRIRRAAAVIEVTQEAIDAAAIDVLAFTRTELERKLTKLIGDAPWRDHIVYRVESYTRPFPVYADDANWDDDDDPPEPIGYEDVPMVVVQGSCRFAALVEGDADVVA